MRIYDIHNAGLWCTWTHAVSSFLNGFGVWESGLWDKFYNHSTIKFYSCTILLYSKSKSHHFHRIYLTHDHITFILFSCNSFEREHICFVTIFIYLWILDWIRFLYFQCMKQSKFLLNKVAYVCLLLKQLKK